MGGVETGRVGRSVLIRNGGSEGALEEATWFVVVVVVGETGGSARSPGEEGGRRGTTDLVEVDRHAEVDQVCAPDAAARPVERADLVRRGRQAVVELSPGSSAGWA